MKNCPICYAIFESYKGRPISRTSACPHRTREDYFNLNPASVWDMPHSEDHPTVETAIANLLFEESTR